ncbi:hypothetical protein [uncultured Bilophila sp.]|uniref:hypothetical protein n=1 Tax=uncultured Bilophila sp. TaxID=529385 RepID=UPI00280B4FD6|nr:hypothetical protein [uncultured Bilophila sp.]
MESISENMIKNLYFQYTAKIKATTCYDSSPKASAISYGTAMHYLDGAFPIENGLAKRAVPPKARASLSSYGKTAFPICCRTNVTQSPTEPHRRPLRGSPGWIKQQKRLAVSQKMVDAFFFEIQKK